ncbi:MAG TPA: pyridoxamine 5'-phosphate oxidase family protein [Acidimicrobiales bacterium]|nr:pyridoxamine 5'-phosphate oxidase family protein [Acidimicrobiales bacterium]
MAFDPADLTPEMIEFVTVRHLATLTTQRADGSPHVVPVGFSYDASTQRVRIITGPGSQKARNAERGGVGLVCQVDGGRWLTLEGRCELRTDDESVAECACRYEARYGHPPRRPGWASLEIVVTRCFGRV